MPIPLSETLLDTPVTLESIRKVICQEIGQESQISEYSAKDVGEGIGFASFMCRLAMTWTDNPNGKLPQSIIVKVPTVAKMKLITGESEEGITQFNSICKIMFNVHNTEVCCYETFKSLTDAPCTRPQMFGCLALKDRESLIKGEPAFIVMGDLSGKGKTKMFMNSETLNDNQQKQLMAEVASLHAWGVKHEDLMNEKVTRHSLCMFDLREAGFEGAKAQFEVLLKWVKQEDPLWVKAFSDVNPDHLEYLRPKFEQIKAIQWSNKQYNIPSTTCHGDLHIGNMLWERDANDEPTGPLVALVDWQIVHKGNPLIDLHRSMNFTIDPARRTIEYRNELLGVYYQKYSELLQNAGFQVAFSLETLIKAFWELHYVRLRQVIVEFSKYYENIAADKMPGVKAETAAPRYVTNMRAMFEEIVKFEVDTK